MTTEEKQELNERVAGKLGIPSIVSAISHQNKEGLYIPDYAGRIEAAWEIVEFVQDKITKVMIWNNPWQGVWVEFFHPDDAIDPNKRISANADTAPEAIVRAFLKLP